MSGSEVLYPDYINKNDRGEAITPYKDWAANQSRQASFANPVQTRQTAQRESSLSGVANQPTRQQRFYAQAAGNATDAAPRAQPQLNEWGYYRPDNSEFDYIDRRTRNYERYNPGNIRPDRNSQWEGMVGVDNGFIVFENDHYGLRAMARNISNQQERNGIQNIEDLINGYAPPSENHNNENYINFVAEQLGVERGETINMSDPETLQTLMGAMIRFESSSNQYTDEHLRNAIIDGLHRQ